MFEWDADKAQSNLVKHGVSFEASQRVFDDAFSVERLDAASNPGEPRYIVTGMANGVLLTVVYSERDERTRIISARKATRHEREDYYQSQTPG